jgi:hypothetical protein
MVRRTVVSSEASDAHRPQLHLEFIEVRSGQYRVILGSRHAFFFAIPAR